MSLSSGDIVGGVFIVLWMIACSFLLTVFLIVLARRFLDTVRQRRRAAMDDSVDHDEWRRGSPERYLPPDAKPILFEEGDE